MSWWQSFLGWLNTAAESSLNRRTERHGLKRGDSCTLPYKRGSLKKGTEVMISEILSDGRHCRVVDYSREYHIIHESYLDKIEEKKDIEEIPDRITKRPPEQPLQIQCPKCSYRWDIAEEMSRRESQKKTDAELDRYFGENQTGGER